LSQYSDDAKEKGMSKGANPTFTLWQKHDCGALPSLNKRLNIKGNLVFSIKNGDRAGESTDLFKLGRNLFKNK